MRKYYFLTIVFLLVFVISLPSVLAVNISISETLHLTDTLRAYCTFCTQYGDLESSGGNNDQALVDATVNQAASALVHIMPGMLIIGMVTYGAFKLGAHDRVLVLIFMFTLAAVSIPLSVGSESFSIFPIWIGVFTVIGLIVMFLYGRNKSTGNVAQ